MQSVEFDLTLIILILLHWNKSSIVNSINFFYIKAQFIPLNYQILHSTFALLAWAYKYYWIDQYWNSKKESFYHLRFRKQFVTFYSLFTNIITRGWYPDGVGGNNGN